VAACTGLGLYPSGRDCAVWPVAVSGIIAGTTGSLRGRVCHAPIGDAAVVAVRAGMTEVNRRCARVLLLTCKPVLAGLPSFSGRPRGAGEVPSAGPLPGHRVRYGRVAFRAEAAKRGGLRCMSGMFPVTPS
jgi:hypothetical protein